MGRSSPRLLDREVELEAIADALTAARASHGGVVLLEGAAGTGKTALIGEARLRARDHGMQVFSARGGELEQEYPFGLVRQLYEPVLATARPDLRGRLLAGAAAPAAQLVDAGGGESAIYAAGFGAMQAIYWLTVHLAAEAPLALTIDDAHWADPSSLRAFDFVARRVTELPVALIVALRPHEPGSRLDLLDGLRDAAERRASLSELAPDSAAALIRGRVPQATDEFCDACYSVTAGNPLYLEEVLRSIGAGAAALDADAVLGASVPTLAERVLRRINRVGDHAPAVAHAMAVLGNGAQLSAVAALASVSEGVAGQTAHQLRRIEVLAAEDPVAFVHPLIRRSVYDAIAETERRAMHRRAAQILEELGAAPETVAAHLRTLPPSGDNALVATLIAAADRSLERAAPDEAVGWLERALAEDAREPAPAELMARLGFAKTIRRDPSAIEDLGRAHELAEDPELRIRVAVSLAEVLALSGRWDAAVGFITEAERELRGDSAELEAEVAAVASVLMLNDSAHAAGFGSQRDRYAEIAKGQWWACRALAVMLGYEAASSGRVRDALTFAEQALEGGQLLAERGAGGWATTLVLGTLIITDELDRTLVVIGDAEAAARASGSALGLFAVAGNRAWLHARQGDLATAESDLTALIDFAREAGLLMGVTTLLFYLIDVLLERETLAGIAELLERTELSPDFLRSASGAHLLEARGRLRLLRRDHASGVADLRAAGETNTALGFGPVYSTWRSSLAVALASADREEARTFAAEDLELARPTGLARPQGIALRALGVVEAGDGGIELLRQSVATLEDAPAPLEHARSLVELGSALRRANQRRDSRAPLVDGYRLAHRCGAQRLASRAEDELKAAGGRRPRLSVTGRDALTASELRVANLAATGATNPEIAQDLYISVKTVETHLSRAYLKLGLTGAGARSKLTGAMQGADS
jgi:DNA-binding CsgD family transcriptional regulator